MILYDWKKIFEHSKGSAKECIKIIRMITYRQVPRNKKDPLYKYYGRDFSGVSFLVHPDLLLHNAYKHDYKQLGVYLALASLRSYTDYKLTGDTTLDAEYAPNNPELYITDTELLRLEDNKIRFLYEEATHTKESIH